MKLNRSHKYRIYPTPPQEELLLKMESTCRFLWNLGLEQWLLGMSHPDKKYPSYILIGCNGALSIGTTKVVPLQNLIKQ